MNWISGLQKRTKLCVAGILIISFAAYAVSLQRNPVSFDAFWHLKTGQDWIMNGLSPWIDHYSFTFDGEAISNPPVVFQVLLHYSVALFGVFGGFMAVKALAQLLTLAMAFWFLKTVNARALLIAIVIPCVVVLLQMRSLVRPELISYAFSVLAMLLYFRARDVVSSRNVVPMILLMLVWTNYHSSIIGYVIFAGFFVDCAIRQIREHVAPQVWIAWLGWGTALLLAGFVNHDLVHPLIEAITFPEEWKSHIFEYFAPLPYIKDSPAIYMLVIVALVTPLLVLWQRKFGLLLVWAVLAYTAANVQRMVTPAGLVIVFMMAGLLANRRFPERPLKDSSKGMALSGVLWFSVVITALYANIVMALDILEENRGTFTRYPEAMARYMIDQQISGPIFNDYGIGGFLIYRLAPQNQVYIDGRTQILYPVEHLQKFESIQQSPAALLQESERYGFELIVLPFKQEKHDLVIDAGQFVLDFADAGFGLYRKNSGRFPVHGLLLSRPACWNDGMIDALADEREQMAGLLPFYSGLLRYSNFVDGYVKAEDKQAYFDQSFASDDWSDFVRRFVAYWVFESGDYHLARILFGGAEELRTEDYLASALAMLASGDDPLALEITRSLATDDWGSSNPEQLALYLKIWSVLGNRMVLADQDLLFVDAVRNKVLQSGQAVREGELEMNPGVFCELSERYTAGILASGNQ